MLCLCVGYGSKPYCSTECAEADYLLHKILCLQFEDAGAQTSEAPMTWTIVFPNTSNKLRFI